MKEPEPEPEPEPPVIRVDDYFNRLCRDEEQRIEKRRREEEAERKRQREEAIAERKRQQEAAIAEQKRRQEEEEQQKTLDDQYIGWLRNAVDQLIEVDSPKFDSDKGWRVNWAKIFCPTATAPGVVKWLPANKLKEGDRAVVLDIVHAIPEMAARMTHEEVLSRAREALPEFVVIDSIGENTLLTADPISKKVRFERFEQPTE